MQNKGRQFAGIETAIGPRPAIEDRSTTRRRGLPTLDYLTEWVAPCPWPATVGSPSRVYTLAVQARRPLYTEAERQRRDASPWTTVQGVLAPIQFAVFLISLGLVLFYLATGQGFEVAAASVVAKTMLLYLIMITGSIWEKQIFGKYLFAPAFFWEDVVSMLVLTLHTAYLVEFATGGGSAAGLMLLALAAYASYAVNAAQFLLKLRAARLESPDQVGTAGVEARFAAAGRA